MSLSFVSSAVLSSTDGVSHNEEKSIESKELQALRGRQDHKPLFEQLRLNREDEEAQREEFQRTMMRGTRALDEEDCAHLDAVMKQRRDTHVAIQQSMEEELALFRAARADRAQSHVVVDGQEEEVTAVNKEGAGASTTIAPEQKLAPILPVILKRRRRHPPEKVDKAQFKKTKLGDVDERITEEELPTPNATEDIRSECGLGGLLGGYGSSDSDDD